MLEICMISQSLAHFKNDEIKKFATGHGDDYTTGCFLDYSYFKNNYHVTAMILTSKKHLMLI